MAAFILIYVSIGVLVSYGWSKAFNETSIFDILDILFWPIIFFDEDLVKFVYAGYSDDPDKAIDEYLEDYFNQQLNLFHVTDNDIKEK